jgi:hypothetical protein
MFVMPVFVLTNSYLYSFRSPPPEVYEKINYNLLAEEDFTSLFSALELVRRSVISPLIDTELIESAVEGVEFEELESAESVIAQPVFDKFSDDKEIVGVVYGVLPWDLYLSDTLPERVNGRWYMCC